VDGSLAYRAARRPGAPPVVLVHGLGVSSAYFQALIDELAGRVDVVAPDLPGFGQSDDPPDALTIPELADALACFVEELGLGCPLLVGNSMGCQVAVDLAVRRPELVAALALVGPTVDPAARGWLHQLARLAADAFHERPRSLLDIALDYARAGPRRTLATARHTLADRIEAKLPLVTQPTVVIRGERDPLAPAAWCEAAVRLLPQGLLVTIRDAAHAAHWSRPAETAAALEPLLAHARPGTPSRPR
jgi:pimeloyl-ACP methyl ester carboxylesterase